MAQRGISRLELAMMCRQFSAMLSAGVDALQCLEVLRRQTDNPLLAQILEGIRHDLAMGRSLASAFSRYPHHFSPLFVSMVRQGEREGMLGEVMLKLAEHLEREANIFGFGSPIAETRFDWDALMEKLRPLISSLSITAGAIMVGVAGLWYITLIGWLPIAYLGPNIALMVGLAMLLFALIFLRYRPPQLARCSFCGRPESVVGTLIPGEGVWICADCVQRSVQVLREHQLAVADVKPEVTSLGAEEGEEEGEKDLSKMGEKVWKPGGKTVYLTQDERVPEEERIKILPKEGEG